MSLVDFHIKSLTFSGGQEVQLEPGSVLLLVGPNNSGKSIALREIESWLKPNRESDLRLAVRFVELHNVTVDDLFQASESLFQVRKPQPSGITLQIQMGGGKLFQIQRTASLEQWYQVCYPFLIQRLDTETRLTYANAVGRIDVYGGEPPIAPIHWLQKDEGLYARVSATIRSAFGVDLIINWGGSTTIGFHVGEAPTPTLDADRVSKSYLEQLSKLPKLEQLGDGIRSFVATILAAYVGPHPIVLVDEPEAFLHPPQARRVGETITKLTTEQNRQAIIATHSADLVRGALSAPGKVVICRIERSGSVNNAYALDAAAIKLFWSSPLLRSSQAIAGLFHERVIVCESDADVRFYESVLSTVAGEYSRPIDLYFVHGAGKGALSALSAAYCQLRIPTAVIADIDLLKNSSEFSAVLGSLGGDFSSLKSLYNEASSQLGDSGPVLSVADFLAKFRDLLTKIETATHVSSELRREGTQLLENAADWSEAKKYGLDKLRGGTRDHVKNLLAECSNVGLFLVPKGELEGWWRDGPRDKREWITAAIDQLSVNPGELAEAQEFMRGICNHFGY